LLQLALLQLAVQSGKMLESICFRCFSKHCMRMTRIRRIGAEMGTKFNFA